MKLASVTPLNGADGDRVPAGSPASASVNFTSNPNPGDAITLAFYMPDGSQEQLTLTATTDSPPGPGQFTIGTLTTDTATYFQAALSGAVQKLAATKLSAALEHGGGEQLLQCRRGPAADAGRRAALRQRDLARRRHAGQHGDLVHRRDGYGPGARDRRPPRWTTP
ncbi:MAG: hypothetical protein WDO17_19425 [Alphaproteobacteria bacterium]